ncbi:MAG: VanZ family protein [Kovacikia sp.]
MKRQNFAAKVCNWKVLGIFYAGFLLTTLLLAYLGKLPPVLTQNDKLGHIVLYGIATYLGHQVFKHRRVKLGGYAIPLFPFLFGLFTVVEEGFQSLSPNRTFDGIDLIASFLGIGLGYWLAQRTGASTKARP